LEVLEDKLEKKCSVCGNSFVCEEDANTCWCASLPKLSMDQINDDDCMCKKCLLKKYRKKLLKIDEITKDLFDEEYRYQWKNRH
tara:strand:+ start:6 stop:257 length:252 start_codon:yes stop_codon:yes gene_type:complete